MTFESNGTFKINLPFLENSMNGFLLNIFRFFDYLCLCFKLNSAVEKWMRALSVCSKYSSNLFNSAWDLQWYRNDKKILVFLISVEIYTKVLNIILSVDIYLNMPNDFYSFRVHSKSKWRILLKIYVSVQTSSMRITFLDTYFVLFR